jgi:hypothetical protein
MRLFQPHILDYIQGYAKNKIVLHLTSFEGIKPLDVGVALSNKIVDYTKSSKLPLIADLTIEGIFNESTHVDEHYGKCLFISNIGILMEPELKLDLVKILEKHSKNHPLFVQWDGEIEGSCLYFLTREKGIKININELSHIAI